MAINWRKRRLAFIDVETTGRDPYNDLIVEIAVARARFEEDGVHVERRASWLLNLGVSIPAEATEIHGITNAMILAEGVGFEEVATELLAAVKDAVPCAYNAPFDRSCLAAEWLRAWNYLPPWLWHRAQWLDPLPWTQAYHRYDRGGHKLDATAERLGVIDRVPGDAHRATRDAELGLWVLWALSSTLHTRTPDWIYHERQRVNFPATIPVDLAAALEVQGVLEADVRARYDAMFYVKRASANTPEKKAESLKLGYALRDPVWLQPDEELKDEDDGDGFPGNELDGID